MVLLEKIKLNTKNKRFCSNCKKIKKLNKNNFNKSVNALFGFSYTCRPCQKIKFRKWLLKTNSATPIWAQVTDSSVAT